MVDVRDDGKIADFGKLSHVAADSSEARACQRGNKGGWWKGFTVGGMGVGWGYGLNDKTSADGNLARIWRGVDFGRCVAIASGARPSVRRMAGTDH